jgi:hypothetical protein
LPREQLENILGLLVKSLETPGHPLGWEFSTARLMAWMGNPAKAVESLERVIGFSEQWKFSPEAVAATHEEIIQIAANELDPNPKKWDMKMADIVGKHFKSQRALQGNDGVPARNWSWLAIWHHMAGRHAESGEAARMAIAQDVARCADWNLLCVSQLYDFKFIPATYSSVQAFRYFPWRNIGAYVAIFPMTANFIMATWIFWLLPVAFGLYFFIRRKFRRKPAQR